MGRKREREKNFLDLDKFESGVSKRSNQKAVAITPAPNKTGWLYAELTPKAAKTPTEYFKKNIPALRGLTERDVRFRVVANEDDVASDFRASEVALQH